MGNANHRSFQRKPIFKYKQKFRFQPKKFNVWSNFRFLGQNFGGLVKISIFGQNFNFWSKFRFLVNISIFVQETELKKKSISNVLYFFSYFFLLFFLNFFQLVWQHHHQFFFAIFEFPNLSIMASGGASRRCKYLQRHRPIWLTPTSMCYFFTPATA